MTVISEQTQQSRRVSFGNPLQRYLARQPQLSLWVQQVQQAIEKTETEPEFWGAVGHALVVIDPDTEEFQGFLTAAARAVQGRHLNLTIDQFLQSSQSVVNGTTPTIISIEAGPWLKDRETDEEIGAIREQFAATLKSLHSRVSPVAIVVCVDRYASIVASLRCGQIFDRYIVWAAPNPSLLIQDLYELVEEKYLDSALLEPSDRLGSLLVLECPSRRELVLLATALRRRAILGGKRIGWRDLVETVTNGVGEGFFGNEHIDPFSLATHEAGHALVNMAGSGFRNLPDMVTIVRGKDHLGVVVESYQHHYETRNGNLSFADVCGRIRTCLAGRAAEELEFGLGGCAAFASEADLERASRLATQLLVENGFPPEYEDPKATGSNLYLMEDDCEMERARYFDGQVRRFLAKLYQETKLLLQEHRALFDAVRLELLRERYLMKEDLEQILQNHREAQGADI